ncbi:hypothetical protein [Adhaeribacter radiodurans]|uniref:DUF2282 domain-containing protein n=1 Tax=Adhaeribacter radiodurans TaxID=2745197 RepID=A0A7L7L673_9BACT|nr:hypothetical protein [Adhaeribacter radiodurans]QMU28317.1 hypothetical protein HUW48_09840 [Adhaeribacter radiodurans]
MKKFALLLSFLAYVGNYASEGSILVNTVSFADLPAKVKPTHTVTGKKVNKSTTNSTCSAFPASKCLVKVKACSVVTKTVVRPKKSCLHQKASLLVAKATPDPIVSLLN